MTEDPQAAPGPLEEVRCFANTLDVEAGTDRLADVAGWRDWLAEHDAFAAAARRASEEDLALARVVRAGIRALLRANAGGERDEPAIAALNRAADRTGLTLAFSDDGVEAVAGGSGPAAVLGELLARVARASADGDWRRLKVCDDHGCAWAYYDHSRNRSGRWCSMAVCGNRHKARTYRARTRT